MALLSLDKNESPYDIPEVIKANVLERLMRKQWNCYPNSYDIATATISSYVNQSQDRILIDKGASRLIELLFNTYSTSATDIVVALPSFGLYYHLAKVLELHIKPWLLTEHFEYSADLFPEINPGSLIILASPNNPTGRSISRALLTDLLTQHSQSIFVVDEVYVDFADDDLMDLVDSFSNLILVRSFSKAFCIAGLRLGYLLAHPKEIARLKRMQLPFQVDILSETFIETALPNREFKAFIQNNIEKIKEVRDALCLTLSGRCSEYEIYNTETNFFLIKAKDAPGYGALKECLAECKLIAHDLHESKQLAYTFRISIPHVDYQERIESCLTGLFEKKKVC